MLYFWEHPEKIKRHRPTPEHPQEDNLSSEKVRALSREQIVLAGLLHDIGKTKGLGHHATNSYKILTKLLGDNFNENYPEVLAAIFFHHKGKKPHPTLGKYRSSTLKQLLNTADCAASGTAWNSTRFHDGYAQEGDRAKQKLYDRMEVAQDRTIQVVQYGFYLDKNYNLHEIAPYDTRGIRLFREDEVEPDNCVKVKRADLQDLRIRTNILSALFKTERNHHHHYIVKCYNSNVASLFKKDGCPRRILLPHVCFFRGPQQEGYPMLSTEYHDVLVEL